MLKQKNLLKMLIFLFFTMLMTGCLNKQNDREQNNVIYKEENKTFDLNNAQKAKVRDIKRISDIIDLRTHLKIYYGNYNKYPVNLQEMISGLISIKVIPKLDGFVQLTDPAGREYKYEQLNDNSYTICFEMEAGNKKYKKGENCLNEIDE